MNDPIVDEVRRVRDEHAARFNYELDAIFRDIKEQEKRSGRKLVSFTRGNAPSRRQQRDDPVERDDAAYMAGCEAARADIAAGRLIYRWTGHAGHWGHWIVTELRERFGVHVDDGFGVCFVDGFKTSFNDGYNQVISAEMDRRFGEGAIRSLFVEARSQSEERLGDARHAWLEQHGITEPR